MLIKKSTFFICFIILSCTASLHSAIIDSITITSPANSGTASGVPLTISGTSSEADFTVRLTINTTQIGSTTTDAYGNWSFTYNNLAEGSYTVMAELVSGAFEVLALATNSFTIANPDTITITTPTEGSTVFLNPVIISGTSTAAAFTTVQLSLDGYPIATTTLDAYGNWQFSYTLTGNGTHTFAVELVEAGYATATVDVVANIPIVFPAGTSQAIIVEGDLATTGSGSGNGFTYSVSGSYITVSFNKAFSTLPSVVATGFRSSGSSTVTLSSVGTTAVTIAFSTGTQKVHFAASVLQ